MGLLALPVLCRELVAHGMAAATPAAIVEQGTRPDQRVVVGTLSTLPAQARRQGVRSPALLVIGTVVRLHAALKWFMPEREAEALSAAGS
jgi:uroporphyrin-III C-methyltransferase/precorrin-2 dehydrogenase/sirohydrochlorin ferrochelatase